MSKRIKSYGPSKSRAVHYNIHGPWKDGEDPEPLLKKAIENKTITQYDDGRGDLCWFEGPPGKDMRELRDTIRKMSNHNPSTCRSCEIENGFDQKVEEDNE